MAILASSSATTAAIMYAWGFRVVPDGASVRDRVLGFAALFGTNATLAAWGLAFELTKRRRTGERLLVAWLLVASFLPLADAYVYGSFARHLWDLIQYASEDRRWDVAGGGRRWAVAAATDLLVAVSCVAVGVVAGALAARAPRPRVRRAAAIDVVSFASLAALAAVATLSAPLWASYANEESAFGEFFADIRLLRHPDFDSGQIRAFEARAAAPIRALRDRLQDASRATCVVTGSTTAELPNIVVVVVESFRRDAVTDELMPRLSRHGRRGLELENHAAGSILSEAGMFALLYSESPLVYDFALDRRRKPCALAALSALGYRSAYFSGQPERWRRMEEFMAPAVFDEYHHDDGGTWADWDRRALRGVVDVVRGSSKPVFAVAYLMSSHFEYRFPPEYEVDEPTASPASWPSTNMRTLSGSEATVFRNRYRNTMRFLDDLIMDAVGALDPARTIVVVTGDHGESLFEDGRIGHGYSFAEQISKTPASVVGPGIPAERRSRATLHMDLLPSIVHAATSGRVRLDHVDGRDLLDPTSEPRAAVLLAASDSRRKMALVELDDGTSRVDLQIRLEDGTVQWDGFRNPNGKWSEDQRLSADRRRASLRTFETAVADIAR